MRKESAHSTRRNGQDGGNSPTAAGIGQATTECPARAAIRVRHGAGPTGCWRAMGARISACASERGLRNSMGARRQHPAAVAALPARRPLHPSAERIAGPPAAAVREMQRCWCTIVSAHNALHSTGHSAACVAGWLWLAVRLTFLQMRLANRRPIPRIWHSAYMTLRLPFTFVFSTRRRPWKSASSTIRDWTTTTTTKRKAAGRSALAPLSVADHGDRADARAALLAPHSSHAPRLSPHHVVEVCWGGERIRSNNAGTEKKAKATESHRAPSEKTRRLTRLRKRFANGRASQ
jgi:hypothetical protein